jgi:hypothetical protein
VRPHFIGKTLSVVKHVFYSRQEAENRKIMIQASLVKKHDFISQITGVKRAEIMDKAVDHLLIKHEALSSNPITAKKKVKMTWVELIYCRNKISLNITNAKNRLKISKFRNSLGCVEIS